MSEGLEKLLSIGIDKVQEQTHITKYHIDAVLNERFEDMSKVQFLGFISIFQREYGIELKDLKQRGLEFYNQKITTISEDSTIFISKEKKQSTNFIYAAVVIILFLVILAISFINSSDSFEEIQVDAVDNTTIKTAQMKMQSYKKDIEVKVEDKNLTKKDENVTKENLTPIEKEIVKEQKIFQVKPNKKVWFGYIDLSTHKKYQKVLRDDFDLDPKKEWLLVFGHSGVKFDVDGKVLKFKTKYNLRLLYKDAKLTKISLDEFKKLNRGKKW
jgi:hypothetical protein